MGSHRVPTDTEKNEILNLNTREGKVRCFVNDHPIDDESQIEYHHINPFYFTGETQIETLAPVCKDHHRRIGLLSIEEYRKRLELEEYFKDKKIVRLDDILQIKSKKFGEKLKTEIIDNQIKIYFDNSVTPLLLPLNKCPATKFHYFYILLPIEFIKNDKDLQPRPLEIKRMWELFRHLNTHTQLAPAICRLINTDEVLLFDGQHKSAAQIWAGRKEIECKIYIEPNIMVLKETNLTAHDKLRQMPFYTSILINKWADIFKEEWEEYNESIDNKSEKGFITFLNNRGKSNAESKKMIESNICDSIIEDQTNKIAEYLAEKNRSKSTPLTTNALKVTFFKHFIASPPLDINIDESDSLREFERINVVKLLNLFIEETLNNRWNPEQNDASHKKAARFYKIGALKVIASMFKDVVAQVLGIYDEPGREKIFLRNIEEDKWNIIKDRLKKLNSHEIWSNPSQEIDAGLSVNNENQVREFFIKNRLTVNWILGGSGA